MSNDSKVLPFQFGEGEDTTNGSQLFAGKATHDSGFTEQRLTAESELAIAPVCEEAARLPLSELPAFIAAILQPFLINEEAWKSNLSGL